jgi:O-antigen ligase
VLVFAARRKVILLLMWLALPLAVLATMTRAVWIAFAISGIAVGFRLREYRKHVWVVLAVAGLLGGIALGIRSTSLKSAIAERTEERGPVDARIAVYDAGWAMFKERPLTGWPAGGMYGELARRMEGYHLRTFYVHNTYLALLVEFGIPGLALYLILFVNLFRFSRVKVADEPEPIRSLRRLWPILLAVYLFNAFFVDMAYQFVIGLLFTIAGILRASQEASA